VTHAPAYGVPDIDLTTPVSTPVPARAFSVVTLAPTTPPALLGVRLTAGRPETECRPAAWLADGGAANAPAATVALAAAIIIERAKIREIRRIKGP
jgi:hypothetical protein